MACPALIGSALAHGFFSFRKLEIKVHFRSLLSLLKRSCYSYSGEHVSMPDVPLPEFVIFTLRILLFFLWRFVDLSLGAYPLSWDLLLGSENVFFPLLRYIVLLWKYQNYPPENLDSSKRDFLWSCRRFLTVHHPLWGYIISSWKCINSTPRYIVWLAESIKTPLWEISILLKRDFLFWEGSPLMSSALALTDNCTELWAVGRASVSSV